MMPHYINVLVLLTLSGSSYKSKSDPGIHGIHVGGFLILQLEVFCS